jgi:hypothetical protein
MQVNMVKQTTISFKILLLGKNRLTVQHISILNVVGKWLSNMDLKMNVNEM